MNSVSNVVAELVRAANASGELDNRITTDLFSRSVDQMIMLRKSVAEREFRRDLDAMTHNLVKVATLGVSAHCAEDRRSAFLTIAQMLIKTQQILKEYQNPTE